MSRTTPAETKLVVCVWHPFTEWRPKPAVAGDARFAFAELRQIGGGAAGHGYFCGLFAASGTIEGREEAEVDSFDGGGRGAIDVSGVAGFRDHGDEPEWNFLRADGGAHHGIAAGTGAEFS